MRVDERGLPVWSDGYVGRAGNADVPERRERGVLSEGSEGVRERNRRSVYRCLVASSGEAVSRQDLCLATGLSHPTVGTIVQEFTDLGICRAAGHSNARGGRPAQLLDFNAGAVHVVAVDLSAQRPRAMLVDLAGRARMRAVAEEPLAGAAFLRWLGRLLDDWSAERNIGRLAVALPGVVVARTGMVRYAPALGWHDYPLAEVLRESFGYAVTLENDVNALAIAEHRWGSAAGHSDALFLAMTSGVGMGVVLGGRLLRGSHSAAGEIGYGAWRRVERPENPTLNRPGQLESTLLALVERCAPGGRLELSTADSISAFTELAEALAVVLQNAVCLLDPELLVVSWPADPGGRLVAALRELLSPPLPLEVVEVALGEEAAIRGVARLAIDALEDSVAQLALP